jgi:hypothetical protein
MTNDELAEFFDKEDPEDKVRILEAKIAVLKLSLIRSHEDYDILRDEYRKLLYERI